jgi:hypothetical protein
MLDLDDLGAKVAQHHAAPGACEDAGKIKNTDAREGK